MLGLRPFLLKLVDKDEELSSRHQMVSSFAQLIAFCAGKDQPQGSALQNASRRSSLSYTLFSHKKLVMTRFLVHWSRCGVDHGATLSATVRDKGPGPSEGF